MRTIVIEPYNEEWQVSFEQIKADLAQACQSLFIAIEHVGSTSVKGLSAKPIIDIDLVIASMEDFEAIKEALKLRGYFHCGDQGTPTREAFKYDSTPHMAHHLYVCPKDSLELKKHMMFRDYLRNHPDAAGEYGRVKALAATNHPHDIERYLAEKGTFIRAIYDKLGL